MCQLLDEVKVPSKIILDSAVGYGFIYTVQPLNKMGMLDQAFCPL